MFDSPFAYCTRAHSYVLLDQTHRECAREHRCERLPRCPLRELFTGIDFAAKRKPAHPQAPR